MGRGITITIEIKITNRSSCAGEFAEDGIRRTLRGAVVAELGDDGGEFALELLARGGVGDESERLVGERLGRGVGLQKLAGDFAAGENVGHAEEGDFAAAPSTSEISGTSSSTTLSSETSADGPLPARRSRMSPLAARPSPYASTQRLRMTSRD